MARIPTRREPGGLEAEVLAALWSVEAPMSVGQVQETLGADLAYTTVHTILARLCAKGAVARERAGRHHVYRAVLAEPDLTASRMRRLLDGEPDRSAVLARFVADLPPEDETALIEALARVRARR